MPEPGTNHGDPLVPEIGSKRAAQKTNKIPPPGEQVVRIDPICGRTAEARWTIIPFAFGIVLRLHIEASKFCDLALAVIGQALTDYPRRNHKIPSQINSKRIELIELFATPPETNNFESE